jgi:hypothetical protein
MRTILDARTSSGYASRSRHGIHGVLDVETAMAAADTAARLGDRLAAGELISGPAARRALTAVDQAPRFEGRLVTKNFTRQATAYLARDGLVLFDNPDGCLICVFKRDTALCEPGPDATAPNQPDCRPGCGNAVRTDGHARDLRDRAARTEQLADCAPAPVARRLRAAVGRDRAAADAHDATARPAGAVT